MESAADADLLAALVGDVATDNRAVQAMLDQLLVEHAPLAADPTAAPGDAIVPTLFQVVVQCQDEHEQRGIFERLRAEGFQCRVMVL